MQIVGDRINYLALIFNQWISKSKCYKQELPSIMVFNDMHYCINKMEKVETKNVIIFSAVFPKNSEPKTITRLGNAPIGTH